MPVKNCRNCNGITNTAVSDWIDSKDEKVDKCYALFHNGKWEKGCAYNEADHYTKSFVDKLIKGELK